MPNWIRSVTITPHNPAVAAKATFSTAQMTSVFAIDQPSRTAAIFAAARLTVAMITQLKNKPRYSERNARTNRAGLPE